MTGMPSLGDGTGSCVAGWHPRLVGRKIASGFWFGRTTGSGDLDIYRARRARFASIVWDRDWLRCLGVTV